MVRAILWDVDGTLLDFAAAEKAAIQRLFEEFGLGECTDEMVARYAAINDGYWKRLERGEITKKEVLIGRFREFFENYDHILSYPDGSRPDGSAHFIGNRGFFVLINPTDSEQSVTLPLAEKSLALSAGGVYKLTDFTSLTTPVPMDNATLTAPPTIDLIPREVRIIGVNI